MPTLAQMAALSLATLLWACGPSPQAGGVGEARLAEAGAMDSGTTTSGSCDLVVPTDHASVQEAVDATPDGGRLCIEAGIHDGGLIIQDRQLDILGLDGAAATTLQGVEWGSVVYIEGGTVSLSGLTLTRGQESKGGGLHAEGATLLLEDLEISNNQASFGAGLFIQSGSLTMSRVTVADNGGRSWYDVGGGGIALLDTVATLEEVQIERNGVSSDAYAAAGGGLYLLRTTAWLEGVRLSDNNLVEGEGGALGMGLYARESELTVKNFAVLAQQDPVGSEASGLGICLLDSVMVGTNVLIAGNVATSTDQVYGGGISLYRSHLGLRNATIHGNSVAGNTALGGAAWLFDSSLTLISSAITGNLATDVFTAPAEQGGAIHGYGFNQVRIEWSDLYDNGTTPVYGVDDPTGGEGDLAVDPVYVDLGGTALDWDLQLSPASPLIDAGDPEVLELDGSASDIGAYGGPGNGLW